MTVTKKKKVEDIINKNEDLKETQIGENEKNKTGNNPPEPIQDIQEEDNSKKKRKK